MTVSVAKIAIDLAAVLLLALGIKGLSKVRSARSANGLAALAMGLAVVGLLIQVQPPPVAWLWIAIGSAVGGFLGTLTARTVAMTAMPQTVALFNGCGGMSSLLVALGVALVPQGESLMAPVVEAVSIAISVLVGAITFSGSIVAMGKLQGWLSTPAWAQTRARHAVNIALAVAALIGLIATVVPIAGGAQADATAPIAALTLLVLASSLLGIGVTMPIGGADMPVVISLLNSYSGVAAAAAGFVVGSQLLIVAGAMVGAAGLILTKVMCDGMNRSLVSVLFGGALGGTAAASGGGGEYTNITSCSPEECALTLEAAERVVIVPGYGLAVAQAQHVLREVTNLLEQHGVAVDYAIHPVAGRMPGHMNVLLAEADVPYEQLKEMDVINPEFPATDVVLVLGANDVVNPQAKKDPTSPLYGMPVLDVQEATSVFVVKRGMSAGYSGIKNDLFELTNTSMVFGDAKAVLGTLLQELRELGVGKAAAKV
ncbi:NAD(P)(+) transhydrogenase (Re/Si-specific) subunit beta [Synechococcus sp. RSCCF101]|uniref:NAD(P)(+) transhydrogenase (Re/Si-specific) subunit beta n=1 Tax=Synechococcus sp. RSCCF101 TaxID=2511069 RepID=UPI0012485BC6|nr:NAD(P)(+) transhydrogenase (Re/Si-specific) subunit beta [Synechococcus sp. RSCCF101]QEY32010.1 NAD(P)(+) transhydrogenase (Re/Si-specific) subunit beta [Synechococcus sp. RSCCF101]